MTRLYRSTSVIMPLSKFLRTTATSLSLSRSTPSLLSGARRSLAANDSPLRVACRKPSSFIRSSSTMVSVLRVVTGAEEREVAREQGAPGIQVDPGERLVERFGVQQHRQRLWGDAELNSAGRGVVLADE